MMWAVGVLQIVLNALYYFDYLFLAELTQSTIMIILLFIIFRNISYAEPATKLLTMILIFSNISGLIIYCFIKLTSSIGLVIYIISLSLVIVLPILGQLFFNRYNVGASAVFSPNACFLVLRKPKDLLGLLMSIVTMPFAYFSISAYGKQYLYKRGQVIKRDFIAHDEYFLKPIELTPTQLLELDNLIGQKWSLKNNCFTTFQKFWLKA